MFAKRNSVTLFAFWLVLLVVGIFWYVKDARNLVDVASEEKSLNELLSKSQEEIKRLTQVESVHEEMRRKWQDAPKMIISADEPSFTLSYINWIMSSNDLTIDFDFVLNNKKKSGDQTIFTYSLTGEGPHSDIYKMIWHLTYEPILYKINSLTLTPSAVDSDVLKFVIALEGYTVDSQSEMVDDFASLRPSKDYDYSFVNNLFEPLIKPRPVVVAAPKVEAPKLPPKLPGQIDVERATLKAVTSNSIFISEGGGAPVQLKVGDAVYLGRLVSINMDRNEADFLITKFGVSQSVSLRIDPSK
jgi:hypothetical protein